MRVYTSVHSKVSHVFFGIINYDQHCSKFVVTTKWPKTKHLQNQKHVDTLCKKKRLVTN